MRRGINYVANAKMHIDPALLLFFVELCMALFVSSISHLFYSNAQNHRNLVDLTDILEHILEPGLVGSKGLVSLDARKLDGPNRHALLILILSHATGGTINGSGNTNLGTSVDQVTVKAVCGGTAGKVSRLLHQSLLSTDQSGQVLGKVSAGIDLVELDMAKGIAGDLLAVLLHLGDNVLDAGALGKEDVDTALLIHDLLETGTLTLNINGKLRDPDGMDIARLCTGGEGRHKGLLLQSLAVVLGGGGGQVTTVTAHDLMQDQHAGIGGTLRHNILKEEGTLLSGRVGTKGLVDGEDVVVDGLGHADDDDFAAVLLEQILGQFGGLGVGIVAADGVDDIDLVLEELLGGNLQGRLALLAQTALDAVGHVGELMALVERMGKGKRKCKIHPCDAD